MKQTKQTMPSKSQPQTPKAENLLKKMLNIPSPTGEKVKVKAGISPAFLLWQTDGYSRFEEASSRISDYVLGYYSRFRPHVHNNGMMPVMTEQLYWNARKLVAKLT